MLKNRKYHPDEWSLQEYLDEVLADEDRKRLDTHLAECEDCVAKFDSMKILYAELKRLPDEPLAHDLSAGVIRSLALKVERKPSLQRILAVQLAAAIIVFLAIWPRISLELGSRLSLVQLLEPLRKFADLSTQGILSVREFLNWIHAQWTATFSMPGIDWPFTGLPLTLAIGAMILFWILGNGLLLRESANGIHQ